MKNYSIIRDIRINIDYGIIISSTPGGYCISWNEIPGELDNSYE